MTCQRCEIDYLQDKTATLETIIARLINTHTFSEHSSERLRANHESAGDLESFRNRWPKKCGHLALQSSQTRTLFSQLETMPDDRPVVVVHQPGCGCGNCTTVAADSPIGQAIARQNERAVEQAIQPNPDVPVKVLGFDSLPPATLAPSDAPASDTTLQLQQTPGGALVYHEPGCNCGACQPFDVVSATEVDPTADEALPPLPPGERHPYAPIKIPKRGPGRPKKTII